jgi:hypothetical protein
MVLVIFIIYEWSWFGSECRGTGGIGFWFFLLAATFLPVVISVCLGFGKIIDALSDILRTSNRLNNT